MKKNARELASGLIVPGDLPDDKMRGNSQVVKLFQATCPINEKNARELASGQIVPGDLPDDNWLLEGWCANTRHLEFEEEIERMHKQFDKFWGMIDHQDENIPNHPRSV